jgi:HPt (histidine-containing phosphotransfer) domain-containing protein
LEEQPANQLIPGEHVVDADEMAARVLALPPLAGAVFEELWESLQWRVGPLRKIYDSFLSAARETLDMLNRATATGDGTVLARRLHSLLGSAGMVGARQVERVAAWLQEAVKADRRADLETGRVLLAESVRRFETELERRLDSLAR